jgi:5-methyltetrahydrofolate--homocysteine methyltransferase
MDEPSMNAQTDLDRLVQAAQGGDSQLALEQLEHVLGAGVPTQDVQHALVRALEGRCALLGTNEGPLPELLLALEATRDCLRRLAREPDAELGMPRVPLVIGVVLGDPHELGKNLVAGVYEAAGYQVHDLGLGCSTEQFVEAVRQREAKIVGICATMSTTMARMPGIIAALKAQCPEVVIMVGGAALDREIALSYGADGYARSAASLLEETTAAMDRAR